MSEIAEKEELKKYSPMMHTIYKQRRNIVIVYYFID